MKKKIFIYILIFIVISFSILIVIFSSKIASGKNENNIKISVMYTNKDYIANYGIHDLKKNDFKKVYSRKNECFSDFSIDQKHNILYYSNLIEKKYNIYKVDLTNKKDNTERVAFNNCSGDMFDLYDNTLIFRTLQNVNNKNYTLGVFDIVNQDIRTFKNDADLQIYKFYYNKVNNKIYTIERSISEMASTKSPNIPSNKVAEYDKSGENKKQIYSANKFIDNISVNNNADKLLFDATDIVNKKTIHSIYLIDLKNKCEKVILKPGDKFENTKFNIIKSPQFSPDEKGFYFLGSTLNSNIIDQSNKGNTVTSNALYYYEFSTSKISKIFEVDDAIINIFKVN